MLWGSAWLELVSGMGELDEAGDVVTAVLCLQPPRLRDALRLVAAMGVVAVSGFVLVVVALDALWAPLAIAYAAVVLALFGRAMWNQWRDRAVRRVLNRAKPQGGWCLHNFVGHPDHPGAGWALLERVLDEADEHGRTIYLDTAPARLVEYYAGAGFVPVASVEAFYAGEAMVITRMVRPPRTPAGPTAPTA